MVPDGDVLLNGMDLSGSGIALNETFESFNTGTLHSGFSFWKVNPPSNGSLKALIGEVIANPFKMGINTSNKVLKIVRQDDSEYVTSANAGNLTYRGAQAYGYDLRVNTSSIVEFKYYKDVGGKIGIRLYDGNGNMLLVDYTDPNESTVGYSTAKWRTAQFAVGSSDLSKYNFTASGYLLISPERNATEFFQEKALTIYVDDVKMLPLSTEIVKAIREKSGFSAYYDYKTGRIMVSRLPEETYLVKLFDFMGRLIQEVQVMGDMALLNPGESDANVFIVQVLNRNGKVQSLKVGKL